MQSMHGLELIFSLANKRISKEKMTARLEAAAEVIKSVYR